MKIWIYNNIIWYLKQLLPFQYHTRYQINDEVHRTVWRMWFGRCFNAVDWIEEGEE